MEILGIDIGGTGIKGAVVNIKTGDLVSERIKFKTPPGAELDSVCEVVNLLVKELGWKNKKPIGFGFPAIIKDGVCFTATNISKNWIGKNLHKSFAKCTGNKQIYCLNDADAAGIAEVTYNPDGINQGTTIFLTIGTGIGSATFKKGLLLRNTELGSLFFKGDILERYASNRVKKELSLDYPEWTARLNEVLQHIERVMSPDLFILGGGISKRFHLFEEYLKTSCPVKKSKYENAAGTIGAAYAAYKAFN